METIEQFSDFLRKIGAHNFLAIGIAVIVIWLLISGFRKGLKKKDQADRTEKDGGNQDNDPTDCTRNGNTIESGVSSRFFPEHHHPGEDKGNGQGN